MKLLVFYAAIISFATAGIIQQDSDEGSHHEYHSLLSNHDHDTRPTSYQNINIKHYHPVPVYIKKEHKHLLEHPVSTGESSSNLEVQHDDKNDFGYAYGDNKQSFGEYGDHGDDGGSYGGHLESGGENYGNSQEHSQEQDEQDSYGHFEQQYGGENQEHYQGDDSSKDGDGSY